MKIAVNAGFLGTNIHTPAANVVTNKSTAQLKQQ